MKALVLAGGFPQIALIKELKKRGCIVLLADYNLEPVAKPYADKFFQVSTLDVDAITKLARNEKVDFLITACTDQALLTVAFVSEQLGLPCYIDYKTALNVTNKEHMKKVFVENDISTAKHVIMETFQLNKIDGFKYPMVVKPVDCNSSKGVKKVYCQEDLKIAFLEAVSLSRTGTAIIEEYIEGREITVDVQVKDGRAIVLSCAYSDKIPDNEKFVIFRTRYPVNEKSFVMEQISELAQKITESFGLTNTMMLIQMISDGERVYVIEFSARTGGGVKYDLIKRVSGFDVISAVIDLTLQKDIEVTLKQPVAKYVTNTFIYCKSGKFDKLIGFEDLKNERIIEDFFVFKWIGAVMGGATNSGDRIAGFTVQSDSVTDLQEKYDKVISTIKVLDENGEDIMRHDLMSPLIY